MKCLVSSIITLFCLFYCTAQKPQFGLTAGVTFASYKIKIESFSYKSKLKAGFTAGITSAVRVADHFNFMPSLNFTQKGGSDDDKGIQGSFTLNYLELLLNLVYKKEISAGNFFVGGGPSFSYRLSGKLKEIGTGNDADLNAFDIGAHILAGLEFKGGVLISAHYNFALNNLASDDGRQKAKYHNPYFALRLGYMFH